MHPAELQQAFNRTGLRKQGYTLEQALQVPMLCKCLQRIAQTAHQRNAKPPRAYWWQKI